MHRYHSNDCLIGDFVDPHHFNPPSGLYVIAFIKRSPKIFHRKEIGEYWFRIL